MYEFKVTYRQKNGTRWAEIHHCETANDLPRVPALAVCERISVRCTGTDKRGMPCQRWCPEGVERCHSHALTEAEERDAAIAANRRKVEAHLRKLREG